MDLVIFLLLYTGIIGGCGYVFFAGDPDEPGVLGRINKLITRDLAEGIRLCLFKCVGQQGVEAFDGTEEYLCWSANPLLQIFYLAIIGSGFACFVAFGLPFVECNDLIPCVPAAREAGVCPFLPSWHRITGYAAMTVCILSWVACCMSEPGCADENTPMAAYCHEWDGSVHVRKVCLPGHPGSAPAGQGLLQPARASYCRFNNKLVLRFDHYCPWIKNAVGEHNYRYFVGFLMIHWMTLGYAAWGTATMLLGRLAEEKFWSAERGLAQIYDPVSGLPRNISWVEVSRVMLMVENKVMLLCLFCTFLSFVIFLFWAYLAPPNTLRSATVIRTDFGVAV